MRRSRPVRAVTSARRWRRRWIAFGVALAAALLLLFDWNWFKPLIEQRISAATGRAFAIDGDFDVEFGWPPVLVAEQVRLANAPGAATPQMFEAERVAIAWRPWAAVRGRWRLPQATLVEPQLRIERLSDGNWNWGLPADVAGGDPGQLVIDRLTVERGAIDVADARRDTALSLAVHSRPDADDASALLVRGHGRYRDRDFELQGRVDSPLALRDPERPYRVELRARAGATHAELHGWLRAQLQLDRFALQFALRGNDLAELYRLLDLALPSTPPYRLDGRLTRRGDVWRYRGFTGTLGDSDLAGDLRIDLSGERPVLDADLRSRRLDFDDLAGFVGGVPDPQETASTAQQHAAAEQAESGRVLPQHEYDLERLRAIDADVRLQAATIEAGWPIDALHGRLKLDNGVAEVDPLAIEIAGGRFDGRIRLDASGEPLRAGLDATLRGIELPKLFDDATLAADSSGRIGGRLQIDGRGNSIAAMLANGNGDVSLVMGPGRISNLLLELAGLDFAEALGFLIGRDRQVAIRCAYADFKLVDGVLVARSLALDSSDTLVLGQGRIELAAERLALELHPRPKDPSILALRSPLAVTGPLRDPDIGPKAGPLAARGAAAALLAAIAPPAALLALVETGPGEDIDCSGVVAAAEQVDGD